MSKKNKKKKKGMLVNNLEVISGAKSHFLALCIQYEQMGRMFASVVKVAGHVQYQKTTLPADTHRILEQYQEMGEEMKNIGAYLDLMPGKKVLSAEESEEKSEQTFVNNIEPEKEDPSIGEDALGRVDGGYPNSDIDIRNG